jgi:hypothetical protein
VDQPDRHRIQEVQLHPARPACDDESRAFENAQVLHHAEPRHFQLGFELAQRAAVTLEEQVEQEAAGRVGERLEYPVVVWHRQSICDHMVTYQVVNSEGTIEPEKRRFEMSLEDQEERPRGGHPHGVVDFVC